MINLTYVTFEQTVMLKGKGFDEKCAVHYSYGEHDTDKIKQVLYYGGFTDKNGIRARYSNSDLKCSWELPYGNFAAPEQALVVEWLRVHHNIWVSITPPRPRKLETWGFYITNADNEDILLYENKGYKSPQEAYSAAFDYVLNNLI